LLIGNSAATLVLALLGYLVMRRLLMPVTLVIRRMRDTVNSPEPFPESDFPSGDSEMVQLVRTYNAMAEAIDAKAEADRRLAERERFVSLGRLSSSLAHEINNPLGGLLNAADTLKTYADRPEVVRESADLLIRGLGHLRDVARATLDQNRLDRSGAMLAVEDFDDLRLLIQPEVSRQMQTLDWGIDTDPGTLAEFASAPVRQIALNLLLNATDAAEKGGQVGLLISANEAALHLEVSDTGPGLSKSACARLLGKIGRASCRERV